MAKSISDPYQDYKKIVSEKELAKGVLLICPDQVRKKRALDLLCSERKINISNSFEAKNLNFTALNSCLQNRSLFDPSPVSLVQNAQNFNAEETKKLAQLLDKGSFEGSLIITANALPATNQLKKLFQSKFNLVEFPELKGVNLKRWIEKELRNSGIEKFSARETDLILAIGKEDPDSILNIIQHLSIYAENNRITEEDISNVFRVTTESQDFAILDSLKASGKPSDREILINRLINIEDKNPFLLISILNKSFANYCFIKLGLQAGSKQATLRETLGVNSWVFDKYSQAAGFYSSTALKKCLQSLVRADSRLKNRNLGNESVFSKLLEELAPVK